MFDLYLINLPRSVDRLAAFEKNLPDFVNYNKVTAVDGLKNEDTKVYSHLVPEYFGRNTQIKPGVFGVFCSHYKIWKKIVESDSPIAIVMEDDTKICGDREGFLDAHKILMDENLDLLFINRKATWWLEKLEGDQRFYSITEAVKSYAPYSEFPFNPSSIGSDGYVLTRRAAKKLIEFTDEYLVSLDVDVFFVMLSVKLESEMLEWVHFRHGERLGIAREVPRLHSKILTKYLTTNVGGELGKTTIHGLGKIEVSNLK